MATIFTVEKDGEIFEIEGPDNATEKDLQQFIENELSVSTPESTDPTFLNRLQQFGALAQAASPIGTTALASNLIETGLSKAGETVTEELGKRQVNPNIAAGAGLLTEFAPQAVVGSRKKVIDTGRKILRRAFPSDTALKRGLEQAESLGGIRQTIPEVSDLAKTLGLKKSADIKTIINKVLDVRRKGETLPPQAARDATKLIDEALNKAPNFLQSSIQKVFKGASAEGALATPLEKALGARARRFTRGIVDTAAPRGIGLRKAIGRKQAAKRAAKGAGALAAGSFGAGQLLDFLRDQ